MRELKDEKLKMKLDRLFENIIKLKRLDIDNYYCANLLDFLMKRKNVMHVFLWFNPSVRKDYRDMETEREDTMILKYQMNRWRKYVIN